MKHKLFPTVKDYKNVLKISFDLLFFIPIKVDFIIYVYNYKIYIYIMYKRAVQIKQHTTFPTQQITFHLFM